MKKYVQTLTERLNEKNINEETKTINESSVSDFEIDAEISSVQKEAFRIIKEYKKRARKEQPDLTKEQHEALCDEIEGAVAEELDLLAQVTLEQLLEKQLMEIITKFSPEDSGKPKSKKIK